MRLPPPVLGGEMQTPSPMSIQGAGPPPPPPVEVPADPADPFRRQAMVMRPYSVQAWADLVYGDGRVVVRTADQAADPVGDAQRIAVVLGRGPAPAR